MLLKKQTKGVFNGRPARGAKLKTRREGVRSKGTASKVRKGDEEGKTLFLTIENFILKE
jgi:hypothetical protein